MAARIVAVKATIRYPEYWAYIRHAESLRFHVVGVLTAVGAAGVALATATEIQIGRKESLWILIGYGLLVGFAGFYLLAHKASYDRYVRLVREHEPPVNQRRDPVHKDAFTWLLAMLAVSELGVVVSTFLTSGTGYVELAVIAIAVAVLFIASWVVIYWFIRRNHPDACLSRLEKQVDPTAGEEAEKSDPSS